MPDGARQRTSRLNMWRVDQFDIGMGLERHPRDKAVHLTVHAAIDQCALRDAPTCRSRLLLVHVAPVEVMSIRCVGFGRHPRVAAAACGRGLALQHASYIKCGGL